MSCDVSFVGTLKKVDLGDLSIEEVCKQMCTTLLPKAEFYKFQTSYKSWQACLADNFYNEYFIHNNILYKVDLLEQSDDDPYFCKVIATGKDEYTFAGTYYNGSCSMYECIEEEMDRMSGNKKTSKEWQELYPDPKVVDPDGWNRKCFKYSWEEELITLEEYKQRVNNSSVISNC